VTNDELLEIDELMQRSDPESNNARQLRAHALFAAAKLERGQGHRELADQLKATGNRLVEKNFQANYPPEQRDILLNLRRESGSRLLARSLFNNRGLSARTIEALVACGIDAPERLLFATEAELKRLSGIGKASLGEIMRYRTRFLPEGQRRSKHDS
jgi:DNA-directed RNA polymerase alpha subunit